MSAFIPGIAVPTFLDANHALRWNPSRNVEKSERYGSVPLMNSLESIFCLLDVGCLCNSTKIQELVQTQQFIASYCIHFLWWTSFKYEVSTGAC